MWLASVRVGLLRARSSTLYFSYLWLLEVAVCLSTKLSVCLSVCLSVLLKLASVNNSGGLLLLIGLQRQKEGPL